MPLFDDRGTLDLFRLDRGYRRLMVVMRPQVSVHVLVVVVLVADARPTVHLIGTVVGMVHHAVRVTVVMVPLIVGTRPRFDHVVLAAGIRWPAGRGLPVGPESRKKHVSNRTAKTKNTETIIEKKTNCKY